MHVRIGVFDSGIGGKTVAVAIQESFPSMEVVYACDTDNVPYGVRSGPEIIKLTNNGIKPLLRAGCGIIVIACNTATAAAIEHLRGKYPKIKFIGLEPMVKPAAENSKSGVIAVCATPYTLVSSRYIKLKDLYASDLNVLQPDCSRWAEMIENNSITADYIRSTINEQLDGGADVIVLACTHYHWIKQEISEIVQGRTLVIDPSDAIVQRVKVLLG